MSFLLFKGLRPFKYLINHLPVASFTSLCSLCVLCVSVASAAYVMFTTETQRTERLHRELAMFVRAPQGPEPSGSCPL